VAGTGGGGLALPGDTLVYSRESLVTAELYRVKLDEGKPQQLTHGGDPEQKIFLALTADDHVVFGPGWEKPKALMAEPISGASPAVTLADAGTSPVFLAVTSDNRVVYDKSGELHSTAADGSGDRVLAAWPYNFHGITAGGWILYGETLWLYAARGNEPAVAIVQDGNANQAGAVAVDGDKVVFAQTDRLVKLDVAATPPSVVEITSGGEFTRVWLSADRVFYQWTPSGSSPDDLYTIGLDGSSKTALTNDPTTLHFFSGLDSQSRVIYDTGDSLWSVPLAGGAATHLLDQTSLDTLTADDYVVGMTWGNDIRSIRTDGSGEKLLAVDRKLCVATQLGNVVWYKPGDLYAEFGSVSSDVKHEVENLGGLPFAETSNGLIVGHGAPSMTSGIRLYATLDGADLQYLPTSGPNVPDGNDRLQAVLH